MSIKSSSNNIIDAADVKKIWQLFSKYWYIYLGFILIAGAVSIFIIHKSTTIYQAKITVLLESEEESNIQENVLGGLMGRSFYQYRFNTFNEIANEKRIIKSTNLINQTLDKLDFDISYFIIGRIRTTEKYKVNPFSVTSLGKKGTQHMGPYKVEIKNSKKYRLFIEEENIKYDAVHYFDKPVKTKHFHLIIHKNSRLDNLLMGKTIDLSDAHFRFTINGRKDLIKKYKRSLNITNVEYSDILEISCEDEIPERATDFLDTLAAVYLEYSLKRKKSINNKTVDFIDQQLDEVIKSLNQIEMELESYKRQNFMLNLEQAQSAYFNQLLSYETQKVRLKLQYKLIDYLYQYLITNQDDYGFSPALLNEEEFPYLKEFFNKLFDLQQQKKGILSKTTEQGFTIKQIDSQIKNLKEQILQHLQNIKKSIPLNVQVIEAQIEEYKKQIQQIPEAERILVNIQRKLKVNEEVYLYLLEKRAETIIARGGIIADKTIIENARSLGIVKPDQQRIVLSALGIGFILSLLTVFVKEIFFKTIGSKSELEEISDIPILGVIGKASVSHPEYPEIDQRPKTVIAESFRRIRTNLDYLASEIKNKVILITSSFDKEGKTFCAINTAIILAKAHKKVLLLGLDFHKPALQKTFHQNNDQGMTTFLIGKASEKDIIKSTKIENLDIVLSGPIPPNPSELLLNPKVDQFIQKAKEKYDYVVIDTPPVGMITDALVLMKKVDINLYIVRANKAKREHVEQANEILEKHHPNNFSFILNGVKTNRKHYKYY